jgi:phosphoribosylglycinamide formyltransferase 1
MKKLAIMGSGNGSNFEAIAKYLKNIEITCLSNVKDAYMLERAKKLGINHQFLPFSENLNYFSENKFDLIVLAGYMRIISENVLNEMGSVINIHPSLLPSFKGSVNAIKDAFFAGVKVSGVTIHYVTTDIDGGKIIAQYPVLIDSDTHFDEFESQIHALEHKLYPIVIEKLLENKIFSLSSFGGCKSNCGDCKK